MHEMFIDDSFRAAVYDVVEDFYSLLDELNFAIANVVSSFLPAMELFSYISNTLGYDDETWTVTGEHLNGL